MNRPQRFSGHRRETGQKRGKTGAGAGSRVRKCGTHPASTTVTASCVVR
jgi:hypothetical protein